MPLRRPLPALPAMALVTLIWGGNFSVSKYALTHLPVMTFSAVRFLLASLLLWIIVRLLEPPARLPARAVWRIIGLGVIGNTVYQIAFMTGLSMTTATNSSLLVSSTPVAVVLLGVLFGVERPSPAVWGAVLMGTAGVVLVVLSRGGGAAFGSATVRGDLLTFGAVLCWAAFTIGVRALPGEVTPLRLTAIATTAGMPGLVLLAIPEVGRIAWAALPWTVWAAVGYASILSVVLAYVIWNAMVRQVGSSRTALLGMMVPLWAALIAAVALGERPTRIQLAGAALIVGSVLASRLGQPAPVLVREDEAAG